MLNKIFLTTFLLLATINLEAMQYMQPERNADGTFYEIFSESDRDAWLEQRLQDRNFAEKLVRWLLSLNSEAHDRP